MPAEKFRGKTLLLLMAWSCQASSAAGGEPSRPFGWRRDGSGLFPEAEPPLEWNADEGKNILWKAEVGQSQSSPIALGGRVLVTAEQDLLVCVERETGKVLWKRDNGYGALPAGARIPQKRPPSAPGCGYSTPTPVSDGTFVHACFGTGMAASYDLEGRRRWVRLIEMEQASEYGRSASPVLAGGKLILSLGGLVALDPADGRTLWEAKEPASSFGTPAVTRIGNVDVLVTPMGDCVRVADGKVLASGMAKVKYVSPIVSDGLVIFGGSPIAAWRLPEKAGESAPFAKLWTNEDVEGECFASPVCLDGLVYLATNDGKFFILDEKTGTTVSQKEIEIPSAGGEISAEPANIYPSLTLVGKHLLLSNDAGHTLVLKPGREYSRVGRNSLDSGTGSSPAALGKQLFLRGGKWLYCIGAK